MVVAATVPNLAIGIVLVVLRAKILTAVRSLAPSLSPDGIVVASRVILVAGVLLIALPVLVLASFLALG